jgi:hypothetical protein
MQKMKNQENGGRHDVTRQKPQLNRKDPPITSPPVGECVAMQKSHQCHSEPLAKNLAFPVAYGSEILRLSPQDDIATQSLAGERREGAWRQRCNSVS